MKIIKFNEATTTSSQDEIEKEIQSSNDYSTVVYEIKRSRLDYLATIKRDIKTLDEAIILLNKYNTGKLYEYDFYFITKNISSSTVITREELQHLKYNL